MAQRSGQKRRAPAYSADTLALRMMAGIALAALGIVIFLAVDLQMNGNVFTRVKDFCYGLTGSLAVVLAVLPVWAGVLVIISTQRKAPTRPLLYAAAAYMGLATFLVLVTRYGSQPFLGYLTSISGNSWGDVIRNGYQAGMSLRQSGGALGVLLGWPLWLLTGEILGAVIVFLLTLLCVMLAMNLSPVRIRNMLAGKEGIRRDRQDARSREAQEQIAWQQEQERQRQIAWQQQQAYFLQQQSQQAGRQGTGVQPGVPNSPSEGIPVAGDRGVSEWQEHLTQQRTAAGAGEKPRRSRLFGLGGESGEDGQKQEKRKSRIFGRQQNHDGLSDPVPEEKNPFDRTPWKDRIRQAESGMPGDQAQVQRPVQNPWNGFPVPEQEPAAEDSGKPQRKTATGRTVEKPATSWNVADQDEEVQEAFDAAKRKNREQSWAEKLAEAQRKAGETEMDVPQSLPQVQRPPVETERLAEDGRRGGESQRAEVSPVRVPVSKPIGEQTWKPELVAVEPKDEEPEEEYWTPKPYYAPPITDLRLPTISQENTSGEDELRSRRLEETLASFNVQARVVHVTHGPAISRFELELASGIKVSKVAGLEKDIAYGMEATSVRIEAPIPGKSLVGVEVPNRKVATVTLREVLESPAMQQAKSILTVALGKDIAGTPVVCDLAKMPHILIAGATGSGKSVCINAIINSLLYRAGPDEVKMILVDPKVVELQVYNGIPHLLIPVVNDPHKAAAALAWAVAEMMDRYDQFAKRKVRNLDGYNNILEPGEKPMPRIVIIIDELADLMMVCKKDVEEYICRLTQLARAAGIHLIVATQRPSVDVITGLIKANIPSRIAFKTASYVDSRTILDRNGSEQLLGWGDMLYLPTGSFSPTRVQGCFLSDEEVNNIASDVKRANPSTYDPDILEKLEQLSSGSEETAGMDMIGGPAEASMADSGLFEQAVEFAIADGQISTSTLQRRLKVGYARAGRLTDEMEERGIVSAKDGSKPRKCLITREQWEEMKKATEGMV